MTFGEKSEATHTSAWRLDAYGHRDRLSPRSPIASQDSRRVKFRFNPPSIQAVGARNSSVALAFFQTSAAFRQGHAQSTKPAPIAYELSPKLTSAWRTTSMPRRIAANYPLKVSRSRPGCGHERLRFGSAPRKRMAGGSRRRRGGSRGGKRQALREGRGPTKTNPCGRERYTSA